MSIVKSNVSSVPVGPSSERNKFHACFSLTKGLRSKPQGTQLDACDVVFYVQCAVMNLETPAVFRATWMCVTLIESWGDKTCSVVVIWTRRNWQSMEQYPRCDKTRDGREYAKGENTRGEKAREGSKEKRGILSPLISLARVIPRSVLSCAASSVVSAFSERYAHSRRTEDRRCFKFQITAHSKVNMKHHIKHTEDYHRRPRVEFLVSKR